MWLEERDEPALRVDLPRRGEGRGDLGRMVGVVVHDEHAGALALLLEPTDDAGKAGEGAGDHVERDQQLSSDRDRGESIGDVVAAGEREAHLAQEAQLRVPHFEAGARCLQPDVARPEVRLGRLAVGDNPLLDPRKDRSDSGVVETGDDRAVERDLVRELDERVDDLVQVAVAVEMVRLDVRDDGDVGRQLEEGAVVLVRLRDEEVAPAQARVRAEDADPTADDDRRIEAGLGQNHSGQRSRRRLSVGPGDRDPLLQAHDLAEHLGSPDHRDPALAGGGDLGIRFVHRGRNDDQVYLGEVPGIVAEEDLRPERREPGGVLASLPVAAGDLERGREKKDLRQAAHADSARSDEMNPTKLQESHLVPSASKRRSSRSVAASGRAKERAFSPMAASRRRSPRSSRTRVASASPESALSSIATDAPAFAKTCAFSVWWPCVAEPNGTRIDGRPAAASSAKVWDPARASTRSAQASSSWIRGRNGTSLQPAGSSPPYLARVSSNWLSPAW